MVIVSATASSRLTDGVGSDFTFHIGRGELRRGEESIKLTERERDLLRQFAQRPGTPIARHELASDDATGSERAIDVQINRLRRKIETDPTNNLLPTTAHVTLACGRDYGDISPLRGVILGGGHHILTVNVDVVRIE